MDPKGFSPGRPPFTQRPSPLILVQHTSFSSSFHTLFFLFILFSLVHCTAGHVLSFLCFGSTHSLIHSSEQLQTFLFSELLVTLLFHCVNHHDLSIVSDSLALNIVTGRLRNILSSHRCSGITCVSPRFTLVCFLLKKNQVSFSAPRIPEISTLAFTSFPTPPSKIPPCG